MAKGDKAKVQNQVNQQGGVAQNNLNNLRSNTLRQNQGLENRFNVSADQGNRDYSQLQSMGTSLLGNTMSAPTHNFGAYGGYQDMAGNGGFSDQNVSDIRARSVAPLRATYANANADVDRQRALGGGYSPNYNATKAKMARELGYGLADANTNVEASLADSVRQGKLAGLGGMTNIDNSLLSSENQRMGMGNQLFSALGSLFGQAPGMASMYGNQLSNSNSNQIQNEGLQGDIMRAIMGGQQDVSKTPSNFQSIMGNIKSGLSLASPIGNIMSAFNPGNKGSSRMGNRGYTPNDTNGWG